MPPGEFSSAFPDGGSAENASRVKKRLIVHIGVHKTGSTSIQHTLFRNTGQMADRGFLYPRFYAGRVNAVNHTSLAWEIEMNKLDHARLRNWAASLAQTDAHTVILSAEDFSRLKSLDFLDCFSDFFEAEVVIYLRRQDSWVSSWYNQHIKWPYVAKFARCTPSEFLRHLEDFYWINYFETVERWGAVVGKDHIHIRILEKGQIQDPIADLCDICGFDFELQQELPHRANESLPAAQLKILRNLGMAQYPPGVRNKIIEAVMRVPVLPSKEVYPIPIRRMILDRYKIGNYKLAEHYLGRKDGILFRESGFSDSPASAENNLEEDQLYCFARNLIDVFSADASHDAS